VIAISALAHGGLAIALAALPLQRPLFRAQERAPVVELEVMPAPVLDVEEIVAIEVIEMPAPGAAAAAAPAPAAAPAAAAAAASVAVTATAPAAAFSAGEAGESKGPGRLAMRAPGESAGADLSLSGASAVLDEILSRPPRPEVPESGRLERDRNSKGGYKDTYTGRDLTFDARIDADGHVSSFEDKPNVRYKLHIPNPLDVPKKVGEHIASWAEDPMGVSQGTGSPTIAKKSGEQKEPEGRVYTIVSGSFDATDAVMRWAGQDPYDARKRAFLEETFDERVEIGKAHRARQLDQADRIIVRHLDAMWAREDLDLDDKRELVFELWDECAEPGEAELSAGGKKARAALLRWVAVHLPAGGDAAFTADELERLNDRRRSKAKFAPY